MTAATLIADMMIDRLTDRHRWLPGARQWVWWDGRRWSREGGGRKALAAAARLARTLPAGSRVSPAAVQSSLLLAAGGLVLPDSLLDGDLSALNTPGGTVDLASGTVRPCHPKGMHSLATRSYPDRKGAAVRWRRLLEGVLEDPDDFARTVGAALTGQAGAVFVYGPAARLVSTIIVGVLGGYAAHLEMGVAVRPGVRIAFADLGPGTGMGVDAGWAGRIGEGRTLLVASRHLPAVHGEGASFARQQARTVATVGVPGPDVPDPATLVLAEGDGILAWMVAGAVDVSRRGLADRPPVVADPDLVSSFVRERLSAGPGQIVQADLRDELAAWCWRAGVEPPPSVVLTRLLAEQLGVSTVSTCGARRYDKVRLRRELPGLAVAAGGRGVTRP